MLNPARISYSWHEINSLLKRSGSEKVHNLIPRPKILYHKNYHNSDIYSDIVSDSYSNTEEVFWTSNSDIDSDMVLDKVMASCMDKSSDTVMSENLGHGQTSDM